MLFEIMAVYLCCQTIQTTIQFKDMKNKTTAAITAAQIRNDLKNAFPGIKFSVRSETYSGGNFVNVEYFDGIDHKRVEKLLAKYQQGHFNGMEDIYENSNLRDDVPQVKYLFVRREMSDAVRLQIMAELGITEHQYENDWCAERGDWYATLVGRKFMKMEFGQYAGIQTDAEIKNQNVENEADEIVVITDGVEVDLVSSLFDGNAHEIPIENIKPTEDTPDAVSIIGSFVLKLNGWKISPAYPNSVVLDAVFKLLPNQSSVRCLNRVFIAGKWCNTEDVLSDDEMVELNMVEMVQKAYDKYNALMFEFLVMDSSNRPGFVQCHAIEILSLTSN